MSQLVALIAVAVMTDGIRHVIAAGDPVPDLSAHDTKELLACGAIAPAKPAKVDAGPSADFLAEKSALVAAKASIAQAPEAKSKPAKKE